MNKNPSLAITKATSPSPSTGKKGGLRGINIITSFRTSTHTATILVSKSTIRSATPKKFTLNLLVTLFLFRWYDIFRQRKRSRSRLRLPSHGTPEEEIPMEKNELYYRPSEKETFRHLRSSFSYESALDWRELKCRISHACSYSILWWKKFKWEELIHSMPREISGS